MFKINKNYVYILIVIFVQLIFVSCENKMDEINALTHKSDSPEITAENVETYYSNNAVVKGKLLAPVVNQYNTPEKQYVEFPKGMIIRIM